MMEVMIIRLKDNNELISFVEGIHEGKVKTIHPHYIRFLSDSQSLGIMPYCPLSDHVRFDIDVARVEFMVLPKKVIKKKYIDMVREDVIEQSYVSGCIPVDGNQTQH